MKPEEQQEARRLLADMRDWAQVCRDAAPPPPLLFGAFGLSPADRLAATAWQRFTNATKRLEALIARQDTVAVDGQSEDDQSPSLAEAE